jgi:hypothetical protein
MPHLLQILAYAGILLLLTAYVVARLYGFAAWAVWYKIPILPERLRQRILTQHFRPAQPPPAAR